MEPKFKDLLPSLGQLWTKTGQAGQVPFFGEEYQGFLKLTKNISTLKTKPLKHRIWHGELYKVSPGKNMPRQYQITQKRKMTKSIWLSSSACLRIRCAKNGQPLTEWNPKQVLRN